MQMLKDPQGAAFYIIQPEPRDNPADRDPEVGEASWLELMTTDQPAATKFYQELFGWQPPDAMDMGDMGKYQMFNRGPRMIGGMMNKPKEMAQVPPQTVLNGPMEVPGGDWILNAMDPQGAAFALHAKAA